MAYYLLIYYCSLKECSWGMKCSVSIHGINIWMVQYSLGLKRVESCSQKRRVGRRSVSDRFRKQVTVSRETVTERRDLWAGNDL